MDDVDEICNGVCVIIFDEVCDFFAATHSLIPQICN